MANIIDYVKWRGDLDVTASDFNDVDSLIISQIAMINFKGIVPPPFESGRISIRDTAEIYFADEDRSALSLGVIIPPETKELLKVAGESKRFGEMMLSGYVGYTNVAEETQFAALTAEIGDGRRFVAFRGTDDTIVGWKEDFNLSFLSPIPAQTEAKKYIEDLATMFDGKIIVGGHSKGGNLAVYAATKVDIEVQKRIMTVYNHDAPGFSREFLESEEFLRVAERIKTIVPQSSLVGMLFENKGDYEIVKSTMTGIFQHNPFSWEVLGAEFVKLSELAEDGKRMSKTANDWIAKLDIDQRKEFVDAVYKILIATEATTLTELYKDKYAIVRAIKDTDKETRNMVAGVFAMLFEVGGKLFRSNILNAISKKNKSAEKLAEAQLDKAYIETKGVFSQIVDGGEIPELVAEKEGKTAAEKQKASPKKDIKPIKTAKRVSRKKGTRYVHADRLVTKMAIATRRAVLKRSKK